jgi:recombination protein RecT
MANDLMIGFKREISTLLPTMGLSKDIPVEKMESALVIAANKNPKLLLADRASLWQSTRQCVADGLLPDGREAALVIFKTKKENAWVDAVQYIPMVFGLRKRALNSGDVKDIRAYLVYEGEWQNGRFEMIAGDEEAIIHKPIIDGAPGEPERGKVIGGYAVAVLRDGSYVRQWLPLSDIEKRRRAAPSQRVFTEKGGAPKVSDVPLGVWADWWDEQALKTLVRAVSKKLPLSSDDMRAVMESDRDFEPSAPAAQIAQAPTTLKERLLAEQAAHAVENTSQEVEEAETVEEDDGVIDEYDAAVAFAMAPEFEEGVQAAAAGKEEKDCPYHKNPLLSHWLGGFRGAKEAKK